MKNIYNWLDAYGESHQITTNIKIHWVCVPLIMLTLLGLLSLIKIPLSIANMPINLSHILLVVALLFYLRLSLKLFHPPPLTTFLYPFLISIFFAFSLLMPEAQQVIIG